MSVDDLIAATIKRGIEDGLVVPVAASKLCRRASNEDLAAWLWEHREEFVGLKLQTGLASSRQSAKYRQRTRSFEAWSERFAEGHVDEAFGITYAVDPIGTHKPLGAMVRPDCRFVIEDRTQRTRAMAFDIAVMRALLKRLPDDETRVDAVFSAEQLAELFSAKKGAVLAAAA